MARKKIYTDDHIEKLKKALDKYIQNTDIPIVSEFAYQNNIRRQFLYENPILSDAIKKLIDKKEAQLERKGLTGEINTTMAIFSLKQLGWKDRPDADESRVIDLKEFAKLIQHNITIEKPNE